VVALVAVVQGAIEDRVAPSFDRQRGRWGPQAQRNFSKAARNGRRLRTCDEARQVDIRAIGVSHAEEEKASPGDDHGTNWPVTCSTRTC